MALGIDMKAVFLEKCKKMAGIKKIAFFSEKMVKKSDKIGNFWQKAENLLKKPTKILANLVLQF